MSFSRILNGQTGSECLGDCWYMGDPEYEYYVLGRRTSNAPLRAVQCISAYPTAGSQPGIKSDDYYFDQNDNFWSGRVEILNVALFDTLMAADSGMLVQLWEDDDTGCVIKNQNFGYLLSALLGAGIVAAGLKATPHAPTSGGIAVWYGIALAGRALALFIAGGDDYVGTLVDKGQTQWANEWPGNTHAIMDGGVLHGRVTLEVIRSSDPPTIGGSVVSVELSADSTMKLPTDGPKDLQAYAFDAVGVPVTGHAVTWNSSNTAVATVSSTGHVVPASVGTTVIRATIDGYHDETVLQVAQRGALSRVTVDPPFADMVGAGSTVRLSARGYDSNGFEIPVSTWQWWSADTSLATVDNNGLVTAKQAANTSVLIWAELDAIKGSAQINLQGFAVSVSGPTEVNSSASCQVQYFASSARGGPYRWETDGTITSDYGDWIMASFANSGPHWVKVTLLDQSGAALAESVLDLQASPYTECSGP
jgi:hypothetical protein